MKILTHYDRLDSLYYSLIDALRYIAFFGLVSISMILSITFYVSAVEEFSSKLMLGFAAFSLESVKIYSLIYSEYVWFSMRQKNSDKLRLKEAFKASKSYILFVALTLLSIVASISFAQANIYSTIEEVQVVLERDTAVGENPLIAIKNKLLDNKQSQLEMLNQRIADLPADYVTSSLKLSDEVNKLNEDIYKISEEIAIIEMDSFKEKMETTEIMSEKKETYNRFHLLGEPIGLSETETLFAFLTLFAVLLEMGIIATAPAPEKRSIRELIENRIAKQEEKAKATILLNSNKHTKTVLPKDPPVRKPKKKAKASIEKASINLEVLPPVLKAKKKIKKRGTSEELLDELHDKGSSYLKSPSQASYTSDRTVDEYLHLLDKLTKMRPNNGSAVLVTKDSKGYRMNYAFKYIKAAMKRMKND